MLIALLSDQVWIPRQMNQVSDETVKQKTKKKTVLDIYNKH